jgi:iron complex outermembrane receptor protein
LELATQAQVTRHDLLTLNVAYLSAVFRSYQFPMPANPGNPDLNIQYEDLSGYTEYSAPRWTGTLGFQHSFELPNDARLELSVLSHAESYYWLSPDHQPDSRQPGYTRSQISLQYTSAGERFAIQAYVHNLENRAVANNYTFAGTPTEMVPGPFGFGPGTGNAATRNFETLFPPRTFGVSLRVKF